MSDFNFSKKLHPAKKAWQSFTKTLQTKLHKPIKKLITLPPIRPLIRRKPPRSSTRHHHHLPKPIFVDELFPEPPPITITNRLKTEVAKMNVKTEQKQNLAPKNYIKAGESSNGAWDAKMLPKVRGVDERAEEFIFKFREDMRLQREQSIIDFQEMLARSV